MKNIAKITASLLLIAALLLCAVSCTKKVDTDELWKSATYLTDTALGNGANTVTVKVSAGEKTVTFTLKTDKATLGEALYEHGLVNDPTFFNVCNGITADWNKDQAYWAFYIGDDLSMFGIGDAQAVTVGAPAYKLVYTR